jgi:hypothetical protein
MAWELDLMCDLAHKGIDGLGIGPNVRLSAQGN